MRRSPLPARSRGYTVLEVMIAITLLVIGMTGVIAMQKFTAVANRDAKNLAIADQIARTWVERLRTDAVGWNDPSPDNPSGNDLANDTLWLKHVTDIAGQWFQPAWDPIRLAGAGFDAQGNDVNPGDTDAADRTVFCTNVRLQWLYGTPPTDPPPYLIRAEVRVFWLREGGPPAPAAIPGGLLKGQNWICDPTFTDMATLGQATTNFHFVYAATAVAQNPL